MNRVSDPEVRQQFDDFRGDKTFELIFDSSPVAMILVDFEGAIVLVNERTINWFGYSREELIGQPIEILVPERYRERHPKQRAEYFADPHVRSMEGKLDLFARRRDGSEFPVDISLHPIQVDGGRVVLAHLVDVTDRKAAEEQLALREVLERMRFMVEHLPAGAVYVSPESLTMNRAAELIIGYRREQITTLEDWFEKLFGDHAEKSKRLYLADREAEFPESRVLELARESGEVRSVQFAGYRYDHHEVWLLFDLTELREAQSRLVQSERLAAIGQMMAALAHESRNAIQRAQACLEMLELDLFEQPDSLDLTIRAKRALEELNRLYEEVRGYAASVHLDHQPCDLGALCRDIWSQICELHTEKRIDFHIDPEEFGGTCLVDKPRFSQVIRNILENAYAACSDGGTIRVGCDETRLADRTALRMTFRDDGSGLSEEQRRKLFEPFYSTKPKGTGLGMAIAKRIIEAHHGEIAVAERGGPGAEIIVTLPR